MFPALQRTYSLPAVTLSCPPSCARALARAYLDDVSRYWRGDTSATVVGERLARHFGSGMPVEPLRPADACSPHGAGGRGIRWYVSGDEVLGYIPGCLSGYRVPVACVAELARAAGIHLEHTAAIPVDPAPQRGPEYPAVAGYPVRPELAALHLEHAAGAGVVA